MRRRKSKLKTTRDVPCPKCDKMFTEPRFAASHNRIIHLGILRIADMPPEIFKPPVISAETPPEEKVIPVPLPEPKPVVFQKRFDNALFFIWDLLDRSQINFLLLKDTAREVLRTQSNINADLNVKVIELGILQKYMTQTNKPMLEGLLKLYKVEPDWTQTYLRFSYQGVTVFIRIIQGNYPFFQNPSPVFYRTFNFQIPNPWEGYYFQRDMIR